LPLFLLRRTDILPDGQKYWLLLPLLASAYGFCQVSAKTDDGYFLGFPSYWNLVAFYIYVLQPMPAWITLSLVIVPALLTFVPSRYLYPTQPGRLNRLTTLIGAVWAAMLVWILVVLPDKDKYASELPEDWPRLLAVNSLFFPIYYMTVSWAISWRAWRVRRRRAKDPLRAALAAEQPAVR
jgi:phosphatidylcholine synthase